MHVTIRDVTTLKRTTPSRNNEKLHYPAELITEIEAQWKRHNANKHNCTRLPRRALLSKLLDTAFWASLEVEEGRGLKFTLCCNRAGGALKRGGPGGPKDCDVFRFTSPRPLEVMELRRLAPAVPQTHSYILVEWEPLSSKKTRGRGNAAPLCVGGIVYVGSSWTVAKMGFDGPEEGPPH